jgi:chromosome partitioning protein
MAKVISITNQKGGVGKSTTAQALASGLASLKGFKVLLVDLDSQGNATYATGEQKIEATVYEVMTDKEIITNAIYEAGKIDILPSSPNLSKLDIELDQTGKEYKLKEAINKVKKYYDYIIIDTPPALGILTVNALTTSDFVVIPAQADIYSLQGVGQLLETIEGIKKYTNKGLQLCGVLLTRYDARTILSKDMRAMIERTAEQVGTFLYNTVIREGIAVKEAQASRQDIFSYDAKSHAANDYSDFMGELLERV